MSRKQGNADEAWTLAAWEHARKMEAATGLVVQVSLTLDKRRGQWRINGRLLSHVDDKGYAIDTQNRRGYPTVEARSLAAALYNLLVDLDAAHDVPLLGDHLDT